MNVPQRKGFQGLSVAAFESRMAEEMTKLIERHGGKALVAPSMQEIPLEDNPQALAFGEHLLAGEFDLVILLTGVGTRSLMDVLQTRFSLDAIKKALSDSVLVARGPKPIGALKDFGLTAQVVVPEPNTWRDLLQAIDDHYLQGIQGHRIAIQEYGVPNADLVEALRQRGAIVTQVPVYRWALPQDTNPLRTILKTILSGQVDVMLITNAVQVDHIVQLLEHDHTVDAFRQGLSKMVVASIGQIASGAASTTSVPGRP